MVKKKITFLEEIEELITLPDMCANCSYREIPVCPIRGTELCNKIRGA